MSKNKKSCAICGKAVKPRNENEAYPFCSNRCKQRDLANWLGESYSIPLNQDMTERELSDTEKPSKS